MDLITLSALGAAANTASDSGGGGGGGGGGVAERTDEHYANTVLLLHGDGNPGANNVNNPAPEAQYMAISDDSPNDRPLTTVGTGVYGTDFSPFYYNDGYFSVYYDGADDRLTVPNSSSTNLGGLTQDYTLECFFNTDTITAKGTLFGQSNGSGSVNKWILGVNMADDYSFAANKVCIHTVNGTNAEGTFGAGFKTGVWYHYRLVYTHYTTTIKIYIDGTEVVSVGANLPSSTGLFTWGTDGEAGADFKGYISNVRLVVGTALGTTVPTEPLTAIVNTKLLTNQSNRFKDNSTDKLVIDPQSTPRVSTYSPFDVSDKSNTTIYPSANTGAIYMDGTSFVTIDDQARDFTFGLEDYTMEAWVYDTSSDNTQRTIFGRNAVGDVDIPYVQRVATSEVFQLYYQSAVVSSTRKIFKGEWTHVAVCRENGISRVFINGELQGSAADTTNVLSPVKLVIGNDGGSSSARGWIGYFHGVRIEKGRAKYTSNTSFNPATTAPAYANSVNTGIVSANSFSNFFDGNDHLANTSVIPLNDFKFGKHNDWTMEGWINSYDVSDRQILDWRPGTSTNKNCPNIGLNASSKIELYINTSTAISSRALSVGKWYHFAFVKSGNSTKLYLDGLQEGATYTDTVDYVADKLTIGAQVYSGATAQYYGWLHGLNILNGVAKYTSNTAITYSPVSKIGTSNTNGSFSRYIPGLSTKIAIPTTGLPMGAQHRTMEFWAKVTAYGSQTTQYMVAYGANGSAQVYSIALTDAGALRVVGYSLDYTTSATVPLNTWFHVSVNYDGTNNVVFLNGMRVDKRSHSINTAAHTHLYVNSDAAGGAGTYAFPNGIQICDLAVYNVAIRSTVFDSGFIPPTTATTIASNNNIVLLGCQSNTDIELANNVFSGGYEQSALSSETPFDNGYWSVHFDGTDDYIDIPGQTSALSGQWSLELWFMKQDSSTDVIVSTDTTDQFQLVIQDSGDFHFSYNGTSPIFDVASGTNLHEWFHICVTRDASNYVRGYINGVLKAYVQNTGNPTLNGFSVGDQRSTGSHDTFGKVSNLRLVVGSIPTSYQSSETSLGTSVFTPPTDYLTRSSQGTTASDVELLICQSGALIDNSQANSGIGYTITASGNARVSRSRPFSTELSRDQVLLACQGIDPIEENSHLDTKLTRTGDVTRSSFHPFDDGFWSADFDGTSDSFTIESTAALQLPDEFTIEFFMKLDTVAVDTQHPSPITFPTNGSYITQVYVQATSGYVALYYNGDIVKSADGSIVANKWYHVAVGRDSSDQIALWLDGVRVATATNGFSVGNSSGTFRVGSYSGTGGDVNGKISNLRIVKGSDVYGYSNATITVPTSPLTKISGTSLLTCKSSNFADNSDSLYKITESGANTRPVFPFANTTIPQQTTSLSGLYRGSIRNVGFLDESSNNTVLTTSGTPTQGSFTPHYPPAGYWSTFHQSNSGYYFPHSADYNLGSGEFTIEFFMNADIIAGNQYICGQVKDDGAGSDTAVQVYISNSDGRLTLYMSHNAASIETPAASISANKWHFISCVRQDNTLRIYVDGVQKQSGAYSGTVLDSAGGFGIGQTGEYVGDGFKGHISNFRFVVGSCLRDDGTTFTVPTSPLTSTGAETKILTSQSNRFKDNSPTGRDAVPQGTTMISTFSPFDVSDKLNTTIYPSANTGAIYMDGASWVTIDNQAQDFTFGTEDWTIEFWVYANESSTSQVTLIGRNGTGAINWPYLYRAATNRQVKLYYGGDTVTSTKQLYPFEWTHIAFCREDGTTRVFMNGELQGSSADTTNIVDPVKMVIGNNGGGASSHNFNGYFHAVRVEKGRAKYTSNTSFNPAATAPAYANSVNTGIVSANSYSSFFDGSDHLANTAAIPITDYAFSNANDFTIEMWFNATDLPGSDMLLYDARVANGAYPAVILNSANKILWYVNTGARITSRALTVGKWYHLAIVRFGSSTTMYLDGLREGDVYSDTINYLHGDINISLNQPSGGQQFRGFIHGLNILNGVAKYTSNTSTTYSPVSTVGTQLANGHSVFFDGDGDYLTIPDSTNLRMGTSNFTIEFWTNLNAKSGYTTFFDKGYTNSGGILLQSNNNASDIRVFLNGSGVDITSSSSIPLNAWTHVALVRNSGTVTLYFNGISVGTASASDDLNSTDVVQIGRGSTSYYLNGYLSNYRIVKGTALYTSSFEPSTSPFTTTSQSATESEVSFLGLQSNTFIDNSTTGHGVSQTTTSGAVISTFNAYDNGYWSVYFDGTDDYIDIPGQTSALSGQWSLELWFMKQDSSTDVIVSTDTTDQFQLVIQDSGDFHFSYNGTSPIFDVASGTSLHEWFHICVTRDASNYVRGYINGVLKAYVYNTGNPTLNGFSVGDQRSTGSHDTFGKVSNLRLVVGSIPTSYQSSETTLGTSVFTAPTDYLTRSSQGATAGDVELLICQSGALIDNSQADSGVGYTITASGDTKVSRSRPFSTELARDQVLLACQGVDSVNENSHLNTKLTKTGDVTRSAFHPFDNGYWSVFFDGDGDYINFTQTSDFSLDGDFTIEGWIKPLSNDADTQWRTIFFDGQASSTQIALQSDDSGKLTFYDTSHIIKSTSTPALNSWTHFAIVRSGSGSNNMSLYINGTRESQATSTATFGHASGSAFIGSYSASGGNFHGFISNFRWIKGSALYSGASITLATTPFTTTSQGATASHVKLLTCQSSNFADNSSTLTEVIESGNANTRPVFPFANTTLAQQTTSLSGLYRGSVRNAGFLDESSNNTVISVSGTPTQGSFTPHYPPSGYWSVLFAGGAITTPDHDGFDLGTNDFTIGVFVFPTGALSSRTAIVCQGSSGYVPFIIAHDQILVSFNGSSWGLTIDYSSDLVPNKWQWLQIDRSGSNFTVSIDGVSVGTGSNAGSIMNAGAGLNFGTRSGQTAFYGYMSNFIMINGSTRGSTATPTSPLSSTGAETKALLFQSNNFVDNGSVGHTLTVTTASKIQPFFPFKLTTSYDGYDHGGSVYFDGTTDYLIAAASFDFAPGTSDYMLELWWYPDDISTSSFFNIETGGLVLYYDGSTFRMDTRGGSNLINGTQAVPLNSWHHIVFCRSGTTGAIFYDGARIATGTVSTDLTATAEMQIGNISGLSGYDVNGYLAGWRWMNGSSAFDATSSTITVPTTPPRFNANTSHDANTKLLLNFTNAGVYDSTTKNELKLFGTTQISTGAANTKFGTGSIFFDGDDYITAVDSADPANQAFFTAFDSDFTWEAFVKFNALTGLHTLWSKYGSGSEYQFYYDSGNNDWRLTYHASTYSWADADIETGQWYHVALVKQGTNHTVFRDGRRKGATQSASYPTQRSVIGFVLGTTFNGSDNALNGLNGFLDEVRVTKGLARYTANFTPMTAASGNKSS